MSPHSSATVKATETSIEIVERLRETGTAGVTELAEDLGYSKGNVHKHLATLEAAELLVRRGDDYALSYRFLEFGTAVRRSNSVGQHAAPLLETLVESVGGTAFFAVEEHDKAVYLLTARSDGGIGPRVEGRRLALPATAAGRVILAFGDSDPETASGWSGEGATGVPAAELDAIRESEIATLTPDEDYSEIAVPVRVTADDLIGVVGLFDEPRAHDELENQYQRLLKSAGERIAKRVGWVRSADGVH